MGYIHFFDDWQLISYSNLVRRQGSPEYVPQATLVDGLTEGTWNFPLVSYDKTAGRYIGLYGGAASLPVYESLQMPAGVDRNLIPRTQLLCYVESDDGISWNKPDLRGRASFEGPVFADNQVFGLAQGLDGGPPTYDPYDPDPSARYKYLINFRNGEGKNQQIRALVTSPNGVDWKIKKYFPDQRGTDTPTSVFYNVEKQYYTFNVRRWAGDRRIFFLHTKDFETFTEPELIMHPDSLDEPLVGFYGMPVFRYENLYIGLLWKIYCDPGTRALANGKVNCELVYSYDGNHFNRTFRRPFIDNNELGDHGGGGIYTGSMLLTPENEVRFYSGGSKAEHFQNQQLDDAALMMHRMRLDGFMYFATPSGRGRLRTRPIYIEGEDLRINVRCPWGQVRVRILDENGETLEGFGFDDCIPFQGDELFYTPKWKNGKTFGAAAGTKRRQLEIDIHTGEIFAIRGDFTKLECLWNRDK
jgi:hypothetical protein